MGDPEHTSLAVGAAGVHTHSLLSRAQCSVPRTTACPTAQRTCLRSRSSSFCLDLRHVRRALPLRTQAEGPQGRRWSTAGIGCGNALPCAAAVCTEPQQSRSASRHPIELLPLEHLPGQRLPHLLAVSWICLSIAAICALMPCSCASF